MKILEKEFEIKLVLTRYDLVEELAISKEQAKKISDEQMKEIANKLTEALAEDFYATLRYIIEQKGGL